MEIHKESENHHKRIKQNIVRNLSSNNAFSIEKDISANLSNWFLLEKEIVEDIIDKINELSDEWEAYAEWNQWIIYVIEHPELDKKLLAVKGLKNSVQAKNIWAEYWNLTEFHNALKNHDWIVKAPIPYWIINIWWWENVMLMEYISWMTLFSYKVSKVIEFVSKMSGHDFTIDTYNDKICKKIINDIITYLKKTNNEELLWYFEKYIEAKDKNKWIYVETKLSQVFDHINQDHPITEFSEDETYMVKKEIISSIKFLHSKDLYHNDTNTRNIILWDDWIIYLIDFNMSWSEYRKEIKESIRSAHTKYIRKFEWTYLQGDFKLINNITI